MASFTETLTHASGRPLRIDTRRAVLAFDPPGRPTGFDKALASVGLEREDAPVDGKPRRGVNQTPRFCFVRSAAREAIDERSLEKLLALLGQKGKKPRLAWTGPVYRFIEDPSDHGLMGMTLDLLVLTPAREFDSRLERALAAPLERHGLSVHTKRSKLMAPSRLLGVADVRKSDALRASTDLAEVGQEAFVVHPDYIPLMSPQCAIPSDAHWSLQWNMTKVGAPAAWDITKGDPTVYVCVVDQGIERSHEELNRATSYGFEAVSLNESNGASPPAADHSATGTDDHGTALASISSGSWGFGGVAGLAGNASLFALAAPNWLSSELVVAINRAKSGATPTALDKRVLLLGGATNIMDTPGVRAAIDAASTAGLVVVCASGNLDSSTIPYPGNGVHPDVIVCGSTDQADFRYLSNYGPTLTLVAPGKEVPAAAPGDTYNLTFEGSSSGAAHTAGLAALVLSNGGLDFAAYPPAAASRAAKIRDVIERTAEKVGPVAYSTDINGRNDQLGFGRIRADWAVDFADVMIQDDPTDTGVEPSTGVFWRDSAVVIRRANELEATVNASFDTWHANPPDSTVIYSNADGTACYAYVRVRNLGPATARNVKVRAVGAAASTGFMYPTDWVAAEDATHLVMAPLPWPGDAASSDEYVVATLSPGQSKIVRFEISKVQADKGLAWPGSHVCGLAKVTADNDHAFRQFNPAPAVGGEQARRNNLCQRNLHVVTAASPWFFPFLAGNVADTDDVFELSIEARRLPAGTLLRLGLDEPERAAPNLVLAALAHARGSGRAESAVGGCPTSLTLLDRARVAVSCGGPMGIVTLPPGTHFECGGPVRREVEVSGGSLVLDGGKRVVETREKRAVVRMGKARGAVIPMFLEIPVPFGIDPSERFYVDVIQRNAVGQVVGGLSLFLVP
ncbi:MAG: S8 family serine peptidase [Myxococcales bacterium]|nr:S8 family serine peptidase [Myxococcales bacterium]